MDILLTEEEEMLRNSAREFLEQEAPPSLARAMEADPKGYPPDLWKQITDLGWTGLALPEEYGGQGLPLTYLGLVLEEIGRHIAPLPLHSTSVAALTIARYGSDAQKKDILPRVSSGEAMLTYSYLERDPRYVLSGIKCEAKAQGSDYVVNGVKMFVENSVNAEKVLVPVRTGGPGDDGISLLIVDLNAQGVSQTPLVTTAKDKQAEVRFSNVRVPRANLIGEENKGAPAVEYMIDLATALLCAQHVGCARKDAEMAIEYAKGRVAFGRPIGAFQSIAHMCADMTIWVDGAEMLTREAIWRLDQGLPAYIEISQAKSFANEKLLALARYSQMIHGGIGFIREFNLNLWYRRIAGMSMKLGTSFEHRARIARSLIDKPGHVQLGEDMYNLLPSHPTIDVLAV